MIYRATYIGLTRCDGLHASLISRQLLPNRLSVQTANDIDSLLTPLSLCVRFADTKGEVVEVVVVVVVVTEQNFEVKAIYRTTDTRFRTDSGPRFTDPSKLQ